MSAADHKYRFPRDTDPTEEDPESKDTLFSRRRRRVNNFAFDSDTARVFDNMLARSIPFYRETQALIVELLAPMLAPNTRVYDLGCSTGTTLALLAQHLPHDNIQLVGVDNSRPMLEQAEEKLKGVINRNRYELICEDLNDVMLENASAVLMVLTLQFVRPIYRQQLLDRIFEALTDNGCFILVEKVVCRDSMLNQRFIELYYDFKRRHGYSELEIAQKREALENVLIPYECEENIALMKQSGFSVVEVFFRWYNFVGLIGIKRGD